MYNSQEITKRIKECAKMRNMSTAEVLEACGLGRNTVYKMALGTDILTKNMAKIADCLNVSVDYLIGRTSESGVISESGLNEQESALINTFRKTNEEGRQRIIQCALNIYDSMG